MEEWSIIREPDDKLVAVRISVGRPRGFDGGYIVFRGDPNKAILLLRKAAKALHEAQLNDITEKTDGPQIEDRRGRPQG